MGLVDFTLNVDDLTAINDYMHRTTAKTPSASTLQKAFYSWYDSLGYFDKRMESTLQQASNRRNAFNVANATSSKELNTVKQTLATGFSREEARGKPRVVDSAGNYPKQGGITVLSSAKGSVPKGARPLIKEGARGESVKAWQSILGLSIDGIFGKNTKAATVAWQKAHGLKADGVVGSGTWAAALGGSDASTPVEVAAITPVAPANLPASKVPVGVVIPTVAIKQPATVIETEIPKVAEIAASHTPAVEIAKEGSSEPLVTQASMIPGADLFKKLPTWAKIGTGAAAVVGTAISAIRIFRR